MEMAKGSNVDIRRIAKTKKQKKVESVKTTKDFEIINSRQEMTDLLGMFNNRKFAKRQTKMSFLLNSKPLYQTNDYNIANRVILESLTDLSPLCASVLGDERLLKDKRNKLARRKLVSIKKLQESFGVNTVQLRELFKIYEVFENNSTFLPEVYSVDLVNDTFNIKTQHFQ